MSYLDNGMQRRLQDVFSDRGLSISLEPEYILVKNSRYEFEANINKIVGLNICALISKNRVNDNLVFTITPYKIPDFFEPDCLMIDENLNHKDYTSFSEIQYAVFNNSVNKPALLRFIKKEEGLEITQKFYTSGVGRSLFRLVHPAKWDGKPILNISAMKGDLPRPNCA